jgi:Bifunctional DNA primase/polymerase, N-terminal/Primase C terminal 2 (PriCT-2)
MYVPRLGDLPVFPCWRSPDPLLNKKPANSRGFKGAIKVSPPRRWGLVGVPTGAATGFDILDIDPRGAGWYDQNFDALPLTRAHSTQRDGVHLLFKHAPDLKCSRDKIAVGVDVRANGGYMIWWPREGLPFEDHPLSEWPNWLLAEAMGPARIERKPGQSPAWMPVDGSEAEKALSLLDPLDFQNRDRWRNLMFSSARAGVRREVFIGWSITDPLYEDHGDEIGRQWDGITPQGDVTAETLFREARVIELWGNRIHTPSARSWGTAKYPIIGSKAIRAINPAFQATIDLRRRMSSIVGDIERGDDNALYRLACMVRWMIAERSIWPDEAPALLENGRRGRDRQRWRWTIAGAFMAVERKLTAYPMGPMQVQVSSTSPVMTEMDHDH